MAFCLKGKAMLTVPPPVSLGGHLNSERLSGNFQTNFWKLSKKFLKKKKKKKKYFQPFFYASGKNIGAIICIGREIWCLLYAVFFFRIAQNNSISCYVKFLVTKVTVDKYPLHKHVAALSVMISASLAK